MAVTDFQVFRSSVTGGLAAYTQFDPSLLGALRRNTDAKFFESAGRKGWRLPADSTFEGNFRAAVAEAAERHAPKVAETMTREQMAAQYDRLQNEGCTGGYNPYRGA